MPTSSYNPSTVFSTMLSANEADTSFMGHVYGNYNNPAIETSDGVMMLTQGIDATFHGIAAWPLYVSITAQNLTTMRRHPNHTSQVFYFNKANGSLFANQRFQEEWTGSPNGWVLANDATILAMPNQSFTFDTTNPNQILYTSSTSLYKNVPGVKYPAPISRVSDPTRLGTIPANGNSQDRIVLKILGSTALNEFRIQYDVYSAAYNSGNTIAYNWIFYVNAATLKFTRVILRDAVISAIDPVTGIVTRRVDNMDGRRAEESMRPAGTVTHITSDHNSQAHGSPVLLTATVLGSGANPSSIGTVQFYDGVTAIGSPQAINSSGIATLSYTWSSAGTASVTAKYSGDGVNWTTSSSSAVTVTIT